MNPQDGARAAAEGIGSLRTAHSEHRKRCGCDDPSHLLVWTNWKLVQAEQALKNQADAVTQAGKEKEKEILALAAQVADEKDESIRVLVEDREKWFNRCEFELAPQSAKQAAAKEGSERSL